MVQGFRGFRGLGFRGLVFRAVGVSLNRALTPQNIGT